MFKNYLPSLLTHVSMGIFTRVWQLHPLLGQTCNKGQQHTLRARTTFSLFASHLNLDADVRKISPRTDHRYEER